MWYKFCIILILILGCAPSEKTNNISTILNRLFKSEMPSSLHIDHYFVAEGGMGGEGKITAQLSINSSEFESLITQINAEKLEIERNGEMQQFDRDVWITLPDYAAQPNGIPIYELKTIYEINSNLICSGGSPKNIGVKSYMVVDDRSSDTYHLFLSINPALSWCVPEWLA